MIHFVILIHFWWTCMLLTAISHSRHLAIYGWWAGSLPFFSNLLGNSWILKRKGFFHSIQNSRNFGWYIKWNRLFWFGPTGIFETRFEGGPLWLVWSFQSVGLKSPFPFDEIVVASTALLFPAYARTITEHAEKWNEVLVCEHITQKMFSQNTRNRVSGDQENAPNFLPPSSSPLQHMCD